MLKPNAKLVFDFVRAHDGENLTALDIANGTGLAVKSVNGIVTAAFANKELMERVDSGTKSEQGRPVKWIRLTEAGKAFDPDAE